MNSSDGAEVIVYHGTPTRFDVFDPNKRHSGGGHGSYEGWYFARTLVGAHNHCEKWLGGEGSFVCVCAIPRAYLELDIEKGCHDRYYGEAVDGARFEYSDRIMIKEFIPYQETVEQLFPWAE